MSRKFAVLMLGLFWLCSAPLVLATDDDYAALTAVADAFVMQDAPEQNHGADGHLMYQVAYVAQTNIVHPDTMIYCPEATQQIVLKFDLAQIKFPIDKARLQLRPNSYPADKPLPTLSAAMQTWDEHNVSWQTRPAAHAGLATAAAHHSASAALLWTDNGEPEQMLAEWLEYRRQSGDVVTILLDAPQGGKCWPYPLQNAAFAAEFADRGGENGPLLELSSAENSLPPLDPTAVQLQNIAMAGIATRPYLLAALLVAFTTLYIGYMDD